MVNKFLILLLIKGSLSFGQNPKIIDSLYQVINSTVSIKEKIKTYDELLYQSLISTPEKMILFQKVCKTSLECRIGTVGLVLSILK